MAPYINTKIPEFDTIIHCKVKNTFDFQLYK